jgi:beta-galactosidase
VRSMLTPGTITVTAKREGLKPAQVQIVSMPIKLVDGLSTQVPQRLLAPL